MLSVWLRVIRVRFLLASVIAVSVGLSINWNQNQSFDFLSAFLTFAGVISLHASVDLLNDYWDFKRGIDTSTKRTKMSGGTGVLPEGLLKPSSVYRAGIVFLLIGGVIGSYFVIIDGFVIAIILYFVTLFFDDYQLVNRIISKGFILLTFPFILYFFKKFYFIFNSGIHFFGCKITNGI